MTQTGAMDPRDALIYTMVMASVAEGSISDAGLDTMTRLVRTLPVFDGFDVTRIDKLGHECAELFKDENGLDIAIDMVKDALPAPLRETAYALACDVIASDGEADESELRLLEMLRHELEVERLVAAGIERGAQARHRTI